MVEEIRRSQLCTASVESLEDLLCVFVSREIDDDDLKEVASCPDSRGVPERLLMSTS